MMKSLLAAILMSGFGAQTMNVGETYPSRSVPRGTTLTGKEASKRATKNRQASKSRKANRK